MKNIWIFFALLSGTLPFASKAQRIAVLDQGVNTLLANNANYYSPLCFSSIPGSRPDSVGLDNMLAEFNFFPGTHPQNRLPSNDIRDGNQVAILGINLCSDRLIGSSTNPNDGRVPKARSFPALNRLNQPYQRVAMALETGPTAFGNDFNPPFSVIAFGANLRHGTDVANAAAEFEPNVAVRPVQIYRIGQKKHRQLIADHRQR